MMSLGRQVACASQAGAHANGIHHLSLARDGGAASYSCAAHVVHSTHTACVLADTLVVTVAVVLAELLLLTADACVTVVELDDPSENWPAGHWLHTRFVRFVHGVNSWYSGAHGAVHGMHLPCSSYSSCPHVRH